MMGRVIIRGVTKDQIDAAMTSKAYTVYAIIGPSCAICFSDFVEEETISSLPCLHSLVGWALVKFMKAHNEVLMLGFNKN